MKKDTLQEINDSGSRLEKLRKLSSMLAAQIDNGLEPRTIAPIARQYRETVEAIAKIESEEGEPDELDMMEARFKANQERLQAVDHEA